MYFVFILPTHVLRCNHQGFVVESVTLMINLLVNVD